MEPRWLRNAPVVEALIDFRVSAVPAITMEQLHSFENIIKEQYPDRKSRIILQSEIKVDSGEVLSNQSKIDGYLYTAADMKHVVQANLTGFTFSRLAPYVPWEEWTKEARRLWLSFRDIAQPTSINRIAARTINAIKIPVLSDIKQFIRIYPEITQHAGLPQTLMGYMMRVVLPNPDNSTTIITQSIEPILSPGASHMTLSLDIDVFRGNLHLANEDDLWREIENLRDIKNRIFFSLMTDKILQDYE